jgi:hypothetical protein
MRAGRPGRLGIMPKIGRPLRLSDSQIEQIAKVSPLDKEVARALWRARAPSRWKSLLEAQAILPGARISAPFAWDATSRRYIDMRTRRYIPSQTIRDEAIDPFIQTIEADLRSFGGALQSSGDLATWESSMIDEIRIAQVASGLAAMGAASQSTEDETEEIAALLLLLLLLLRGFALDIYKGKQPINGLLLLRSDLYARASRDTFEELRRFGMASSFGAVQERRRLWRAEHCHTDEDLEGCVELADLGWSPINTLPRLGATPCRTNWKCRFDYRYQVERVALVFVDDSASAASILIRL